MIQIGTLKFDHYDGNVDHVRKTVNFFGRTDVAGAGAQVLPTYGPQFRLTTHSYETAANFELVKNAIDLLIGTSVVIIADGINYTTARNTRYIVGRPEYEQPKGLVHARGYRDGVLFELTPAYELVTHWPLQPTVAT